MFSIKTEADVCITGLIHGLLTRNDVEHWADAVIEAYDSVDYGIIELSLYAPKASLSKIEQTLEDIQGDSDPAVVTEILLGILAKKYCAGSVSIKVASEILYQLLTSDKEVYQSRLGAELLHLTDAIDLALDGTYGNISNVQNDLSAFLNLHLESAQMFSLQF